MADQPRMVAVVVTYNRRDLLLEALAAVSAQTRAPDAVIVVDNASSDGTAAAVRAKFPAVHLAELSRNSGGAGGFAYGMAQALRDDQQRGIVGPQRPYLVGHLRLVKPHPRLASTPLPVSAS